MKLMTLPTDDLSLPAVSSPKFSIPGWTSNLLQTRPLATVLNVEVFSSEGPPPHNFVFLALFLPPFL